MADSLEQAAKKALEAAQAVLDHRYQMGAPTLDIHNDLATALATLRSALHQEAGEAKREIVGWVRQEEYALAPRFLNGPARPPADLKANYRPVVYDTSPPIEQKDAGDGKDAALQKCEALAVSRALIAWKNASVEEYADEAHNLRATLENASRVLAAIATRQGTK